MYGVDPDAVDDVVEHHHNGDARHSFRLSNDGESDADDQEDGEEELNDSNDNVILVATNKLLLLRCSPVGDVGDSGTTTTGIFVNNLHHHHDGDEHQQRNGDAKTNGSSNNGHSKMADDDVNEDEAADEDDDEGVDEDIVAKGRLIPAMLSNGVEDDQINDDEEYICEYYSDDDRCEIDDDDNEANQDNKKEVMVNEYQPVVGTLHRRSLQQKKASAVGGVNDGTTNGIKTVDMIVKCSGTNGDGDGIIANLIVGWYTPKQIICINNSFCCCFFIYSLEIS